MYSYHCSDGDSHYLREPTLVGLMHFDDAELGFREEVCKFGHCTLARVVVAQHLGAEVSNAKVGDEI